ncbi:hypothetical protein EJB05_54442, partial [Eragrostis curvula]
MEAKRKRTDAATPSPPPPAASSAIASVFGSDDLLHLILLRLDSPTCLVRAAAVSKRWLRHASDRALLRLFGARHPPRPLGFYLRTSSGPGMQFVPMPRLPEDLSASVRLASLILGNRVVASVEDCRNGRLIVWVPYLHPYNVYRPLHPARGIAGFPKPPSTADRPDNVSFFHSRHFLPRDDAGDGMSCIAVTLMHDHLRAWVYLQTTADGETWGETITSETIQLPQRLLGNVMFLRRKFSLLANGKIYMPAMPWYILGLDLASTSLFCIKLPEGVKFCHDGDLALSRAEDSGFYLVHVSKARICVWHHNTDTSNWKIIDTICLRQAFSPRRLENDPWGSSAYVAALGDNAQFVFLLIDREIFYMHISSRTLKKVCDIPMPHGILLALYPLMTAWPPTFPDLAASARLASFILGNRVVASVEDCRNGRLIVWVPRSYPYNVYRPLHPARGIVGFPKPPITADNPSFFHSRHFLPRDDGGDGMSCIAVTLRHHDLKAWVYLQTTADGETWGEAIRSETIELPQPLLPNVMFLGRKFSLLANGKIYMPAMPWYILGLDLASTSLFCIKLPEGVKFCHDGDLALSRAEDSGFYLVHVSKARICVWHHNTDTSNWKIIDTICLRQAFSPRRLENDPWGSSAYVAALGDNAQFVFLLIDREIFYMHISSRTLKKVCDIPMPHGILLALYPLMTAWPPTFP